MKKEIKEVILENENLIRKIAYKYASFSNFEDLFQAGVIGIIKAYNNYDENSNAKFSTYAFIYIKGEMLNFLKMDRAIKVNSDYLKLYKAYEKSKEFLTQKLGRVPSLSEISLFMKVEEKVLEDAYIACEFVSSLDKEINNDEANMYEIVGEIKEENYEVKIMINDALNSLSHEERELMKLRYYKDYTQSEVAKYLNMSQVQVSRMEKKAKEKVRTKIAS